MANTLEYYRQNAEAFINSTRESDFTGFQDCFLSNFEPEQGYWISAAGPGVIRSIF